MQGLALSKSKVLQFTNLVGVPQLRDRAWLSGPEEPETSPDAKSITGAAKGDDSVKLIEPATGDPTGIETVLVVDDDALVREVIAQILRQSGYLVLEASGTAEAQRLSGTNQRINLLLTDFSMPETNGLELARWFQRQYPGMKVLITTGSLWELANQLGEQERVAILPKPFDYVQLRRMVRLVLG